MDARRGRDHGSFLIRRGVRAQLFVVDKRRRGCQNIQKNAGQIRAEGSRA